MKVTTCNVGRFCLSEDECTQQGIDFSAYERGVKDAAQAFTSNTATEAPQPTIPPGYKLVPLEPTTQMRQAVCNCHDIDHQEQIVEDYRAMLAAAPEAPQPAKRIPLTDEEIEAVEQSFKHGWHHIDFARAIIAAYERKNGIEG